jgi:hypothetical protein
MSTAPQKPPVEPRFVSISDAATILGTSPSRTRALIRAARIRAIAVGPERPGRGPARYLVDVTDLNRVADEALKSGRL